MAKVVESDVLQKAEKLLHNHVLCDQCLGRQFAWLSTETTNDERGKAVKTVLVMTADEQIRSGLKENGVHLLRNLASNGLSEQAGSLCKRYDIEYEKKESCYLCSQNNHSVFERIPSISKRVMEQLDEIQFDTFLVGTIPIAELAEREDELRANNNLLYGETFKSDFNREIGKYLDTMMPQEVDFKQPDVVVLYDMAQDDFKLQINPVFIYGRYRKLVRGIPQSRWDCKSCGGKGCEECNNTGRKYPDSVSEYIGTPSLEILNGTRFKVHAAGREDIDVLMLGTGRPFVLEVSEPRIRHPDLDELRKVINHHASEKIEVLGLRMSERSEAQGLKLEASENIKEYKAKIRVEGEVTEEMLKKAERELTGVTIKQRTPKRVSHRRSDLIREKIVHEVTLERESNNMLSARFSVQGGTYVKELISGDEGRTVPSVSSVLDRFCECTELNVIAIEST